MLAGVALAYLFQAMYGVLLLKANPYDVQGSLFWLFGSLGGARWSQLGLPAAIVLGCGYLLTQARPLNSLLAGEETAVSLGLNVPLHKGPFDRDSAKDERICLDALEGGSG